MISAHTYLRSCNRRASALVAALCVVVAQVEYLLPDEHDGDAAVAHVVDVAANNHSPTAPVDPSVPNSDHGIHVDHCAHAHVFASSLPDERTESSDADTSNPEASSLRLASVTAPPHSRPPIA